MSAVSLRQSAVTYYEGELAAVARRLVRAEPGSVAAHKLAVRLDKAKARLAESRRLLDEEQATAPVSQGP
jgi:hypothetical protein